LDGQVLHFDLVGANSSLDIYDVRGKLVRKLTAMGSPALDTWDAINMNGRRVVTGIYLVFISQPSGRKDLLRVAVVDR
jgi:hypothetical protein